MTKNNTGFDAFFRAVTSAPEFRKLVEKDWSGDFTKGLEKIGGDIKDISQDMKDKFEKDKKFQQELEETSKINSNFMDMFNTPEARVTGETYTTNPYRNKQEDNGEKPFSLDIKYFENTNPTTWGFAGVAGMDELKENLKENFIKPLKFKFLVQKLESQPNNSTKGREETTEENDKKSELYKQINEAYKKFGVSIPTGMLFYGPPGTGKTFITKKLAQELGAGLITKSVGEFGSSYIHATSKNIRDFFAQAKIASEKGPIILFLDEIDSLVSKRTDNIDSNKAEEVSQFLQEFNTLDEAKNLVVIAATNRPDHLDSAILRSGRFDKKVYIGPPDFEARKELFQIFIEKENKPSEKLDYNKLARLTEGYVSADIEAICNEVARDASQSILDLANSLDGNEINYDEIRNKLDDHMVTMKLLVKAISETTPSTKYVDMSIYDEWLKEDKK